MLGWRIVWGCHQTRSFWAQPGWAGSAKSRNLHVSASQVCPESVTSLRSHDILMVDVRTSPPFNRQDER